MMWGAVFLFTRIFSHTATGAFNFSIKLLTKILMNIQVENDIDE